MNAFAVTVAAIWVLVPAHACWAQLYLVAATPTYNEPERYAAALTTIDENGKIRQVEELVSKRSGVEWIGVSYDLRKAVILPKDSASPVVVLNLDTAAVAKSCISPPTTNASLVGQWLSNVPGRGATLDMYLSGMDPTAGYLEAFDVNPAIPCERSFFRAPPSEIQYLVAHGTGGLGDAVNWEGEHVRLDEDGGLAPAVAGAPYPLGLRVPATLLKGVDLGLASISINNQQLEVVALNDVETRRPSRLVVFRKRDKTWHVIPVQATLQCRGFGQFVAIAETKVRKDSPRLRNPLSEKLERSPVEKSAGRSEWRAIETKLGPSQVESFDDALDTYTGRLHLYNVETEQVYTIDTEQADSEILLMDADTLYYRISDRLYSALVTVKGNREGQPSRY